MSAKTPRKSWRFAAEQARRAAPHAPPPEASACRRMPATGIARFVIRRRDPCRGRALRMAVESQRRRSAHAVNPPRRSSSGSARISGSPTTPRSQPRRTRVSHRPLYIREPEHAGTGPLGAAQAWWLHHSLASACRSARRRRWAPRLILRSGAARSRACRTDHRNRRFGRLLESPLRSARALRVDKALKAKLIADGIDVRTFAGQILHEPTKLKTGAGGHFRVYTPFWKALDGSGEPPEPIPAPKSPHRP
ncbi:MAG: deoxyribodipyrimidine photo-lyase [Rhizobium sp.]|nr:deoxyribodipyrimidine photo-lyase [Rhizobium sp.]